MLLIDLFDHVESVLVTLRIINRVDGCLIELLRVRALLVDRALDSFDLTLHASHHFPLGRRGRCRRLLEDDSLLLNFLVGLLIIFGWQAFQVSHEVIEVQLDTEIYAFAIADVPCNFEPV